MESQPVSIRSPYRSKGRPIPRSRVSMRTHVSIRSPYRSKGRRPRFPRQAPQPQSFNPLPLPKQGETSGPTARRSPCPCFNPLPLPKQGETHCQWDTWQDFKVSIRSPYRSKGRRGSIEHPASDLGFNPLPLPKQGETPATLSTASAITLFQSARLTEARGDISRISLALPFKSFNPLPLPKQGETFALSHQ